MALLLMLVGFRGSVGLVLLLWVTGVAPLSSLLLLSGMFFLPLFSSVAPCHSQVSAQQATSPGKPSRNASIWGVAALPTPNTLVPFFLITIKLVGFLPKPHK